MSRFFIQRPIFAVVIAIVIMLAGMLAILALPIAQYPTIAPPAVFDQRHLSRRLGRDGRKLGHPGHRAAAQGPRPPAVFLLDQQLERPGPDHRHLRAGTNPDIAQVQVQNKLQAATPLLPAQVQQQGLVVAKSQASFLLVVGLYDTDGRLHRHRHRRLS